MRSPSLFHLGVLLFSLLQSSTAVAQIYADVQVAGGVNGSFTITLEHQKAPGAVANFIGLATGQRGWLDLKTGAIRYVPFYNGITFHRVIAGFNNQTGSPSGDGTDGPGYIFKDEFDPTLRHNAAYTVSMDNSGMHTNGSRFFITVAATPWLDDVHTVFGRVTAGQAVIDQINATPTTGGGSPPNRPLTPITIQSVNIYGPSLAAFNRDPAWLPKLRNARPVLAKNGAALTLAHDRLPYSEYIGFNGTNLSTWSRFNVGYFAGIAPTTDVDVSATAGGPAHFYRMARVDYSSTGVNLFIPQTVASKSFTFTSNFPYISDVVFNAAGSGGTWTLRSSASGSISTVAYSLAPYIPQLYMKWNSAAAYGFDLEFLYKLNYTSANSGTFTGLSTVAGYTNIVGTFTMTP